MILNPTNLHPRTNKNEMNHQKQLRDPFLCVFAPETATVQAQEQRAKDAKSFRRLYASDYNSMLISSLG